MSEVTATTTPAKLPAPSSVTVVRVRARLCTVVYSILTACVMSLLVGVTLSYSSPVLLELTQLSDQEFRLNTQLADLFGVRCSYLPWKASLA